MCYAFLMSVQCAYKNFNTVVVIKGKCFPLSVGCASYQVGGRSNLITHYGGIIGAAIENSQNSWRRRKTVFLSEMINIEKKTKICFFFKFCRQGKIPKYLKKIPLSMVDLGNY